jgi:hypothetical protein
MSVDSWGFGFSARKLAAGGKVARGRDPSACRVGIHDGFWKIETAMSPFVAQVSWVGHGN